MTPQQSELFFITKSIVYTHKIRRQINKNMESKGEGDSFIYKWFMPNCTNYQTLIIILAIINIVSVIITYISIFKLYTSWTTFISILFSLVVSLSLVYYSKNIPTLKECNKI